ncbi:MBL fold metallo-hydrolase [Uliginosibacterium sp. sgz301328]|uniref:MBL fold metallo-hydrolase n=1 Tax=Uliginosibacterium sp. sgz301328 TaxID=3243764 RepID=UPI00359EC173
MRVRVLGCSGGIGGVSSRTTALLVDDDTLIDCGTGVGVLDIDEMASIDRVFVTHAHLDHIALLPMLIDAVSELRREPLQVFANAATLGVLREHIFNWRVWPDFTAIPDCAAPCLRFNAIDVGQTIELGHGRCIRGLPVDHAVPAMGYCATSPDGAGLAFSGDTTHSPELAAALNTLDDLRYLLIETAYTDAQREMATAARHMCPQLLAEFLRTLDVRPEVFVSHLKPGSEVQIMRELQGYEIPFQPRALQADEVFYL